MITPSAPRAGTSSSEVTANDLFLMSTTLFSDSRPIPANSSCELPLISAGRPARVGVDAFDLSVIERQHVVLDRFDQPKPLQLMQFVRILLGEILGLRPVGVAVVEFPDVVVEGRHGLPAHLPRRAVLGHRAPALVVNAAVAEHLEVLGLVPLRRFGVVEAVQQAGALVGALQDPVDDRRRRYARGLQHGGRQVDDMGELIAYAAFVVDPVGPVHDGAVAGAAPMRGHLLGPLIGRVHRPRPADRVVAVGAFAAELVELGHQEFGGLEVGHAVEVGHLVERALQRALGRCAVVADDDVDERVVQYRSERIDATGRRDGRCAPGMRRTPPSRVPAPA